jgi:hypothetical protein
MTDIDERKIYKMRSDGLPGSRPLKQSPQTEEAAQLLAIEALSFLASDPERLERFMDLSGLSAENLRAAATTPGFFLAILDYVAGDESLLVAFAANAGHDPSTIAKARDRLSPKIEEL